MKINKISEYKGLEIGKPETPRPLEEEVNKEIENFIQNNASNQEVERESILGDVVNIDFEGFVDEVPFEGGKGEHYDLTLGSHTFIPGFEDQLVGHKKGDSVDVKVTFPENYQAENLKGKPAVFKCKVNAVSTKKVPAFDDDLAKKYNFNNVNELRLAIENQLFAQKVNKDLNEYISKIWDKVCEESDIEFDDKDLENKLKDALDYYRQMMAQYGATLEQYLEMSKLTLDEFKNQLKPDAIKMAKVDAISSYIVDKEKIEATNEDIEFELSQIKKYYNLPDEEIENIKKNRIDELKKEIVKTKISQLLVKANY